MKALHNLRLHSDTSHRMLLLIHALYKLADTRAKTDVTIEQNWPHGHRAASFTSNPAKIGRRLPEQALMKCSSSGHRPMS